MSRDTDKSLFIFHPSLVEYGGFYQELFSGVVSYRQLGNRLIRLAEQAHAFRQFDKVKEIGQILSHIPVKTFQSVGCYFLAVAANSRGNGDQEQARKLYETAASVGPPQYRAKAILSLAAVSFNIKDFESAFYYYQEAIKAEPFSLVSMQAIRGMALLKSVEGYHRHALKDLENLIPLIKHAEPLVYYDFLNSYAVELGEVGRIGEAYRISHLAVSSPFSPYYPEWQDTHSDLKLKQKKPSSVTVSYLPKQQPKPRQSRPKDNVIKFPTAGKLPDPLPDEDEFSLPLSPLQALGLILKAVLGDKITDDEVERICDNYYKVIMEWYS